MARILTLEKGIEEAKKIISGIQTRPILVAVYGIPNSGKSYLIDILGGYFEKNGIESCKCGEGPHSSTFDLIKMEPKYVKELLLFHCAWERVIMKQGHKSVFSHEDPNILSEEILGRKLDLNIGIYNPKRYEKIRGVYDITISNPCSITKRF